MAKAGSIVRRVVPADESPNPAVGRIPRVALRWHNARLRQVNPLRGKRTPLSACLGLRRSNVAIAPTMARGTFWENSNRFKGSWSMSDEQQRLSRIEAKLDKLAETVVALARVEERLVTVFNRVDRADREINTIVAKVDELEEITQSRGHFFSIFERAVWITLTAAVGALFYIFKTGGQ